MCPHRQTFSIQWRCHTETRTKGTVGWVTVDGTFCGGSPIHPGVLGHRDTAELSSIGTDTLKTRDFTFSKINLSGVFISDSRRATNRLRMSCKMMSVCSIKRSLQGLGRSFWKSNMGGWSKTAAVFAARLWVCRMATINFTRHLTKQLTIG
jgi:hypothetical protein